MPRFSLKVTRWRFEPSLVGGGMMRAVSGAMSAAPRRMA